MPIVIVCNSNWMKHTNQFCSKTNQWQVIVHTPDTNKWWDRLQGKCRIRNGPPESEKLQCHSVVVYDQDPNLINRVENERLSEAVKLLGEYIQIVSICLNEPPPNLEEDNGMIKKELEMAMMSSQTSSASCQSIKVVANMDLMLSSYLELRSLWAFHDSHEANHNQKESGNQYELRFDQVSEICNQWSKLKWRWNGPKLRNLYHRLRTCKIGKIEQQGLVEEKKNNSESVKKEADKSNREDVVPNRIFYDERVHHIDNLRLDFESKAAMLLQEPDTERVATFILTRGAQDDENLFGRIHSWALFSSDRRSSLGRGNHKYLVAAPSSKTIMNAHHYATTNGCTKLIEQLKVVSSSEESGSVTEKFYIPIIENHPVMTISLIPSLFPTSVALKNQFDTVLGSQRIWTEHLTLKVIHVSRHSLFGVMLDSWILKLISLSLYSKASIILLFQGQPGFLWDLAMQVVETALPKTWGLMLNEPPEEMFLRALLHPDVVEAGRLWCRSNHRNNEGGTSVVIPSHFDVMSRIFALARFIRSLDAPDVFLFNHKSVCHSVASTMKLDPDQVTTVVQAVSSTPGKNQSAISCESCSLICRMKCQQEQQQGQKHNRREGMTPEAMNTLGMLGVFLNRDRQSLRDSSGLVESTNTTIDLTRIQPTTKALADCAMYCGSLRWLSENEDEYEGIWTCLPCLHRWQKRGDREAYQTRKLMHPMKMTPFTREEYYDPEDWDKIMEATNGNIARLGVDFYWGKCSTETCGRVCPVVTRSGVCAETDGVPIDDFPETIVTDGGDNKIHLRSSLKNLRSLRGENEMVSSSTLESYFDSEEKLSYLPAPLRRRVRNCVDKSTYILPRGYLCEVCSAVPDSAIDEYCPYCGTGFEPVFACVHYSCPQCKKHFCKACHGIDGIHYKGVYSSTNHVCWRILGNRYSYHNKGFCSGCNKERPWPKSHALMSAGPSINKCANLAGGEGLPIERAIQMQSSNLKAFTERYKEATEIFLKCSHLVGLGPDFCHCGANVNAEIDDHY